MELFPHDIEQSLEFDKVKHLLKEKCLGESGLNRVRDLQPVSDYDFIEQSLQKVYEFKLAYEHNDHMALRAYETLEEVLPMLNIEDYVLPIEGLQRIQRMLSIIKGIYRFFNKSRQEVYPMLFSIIKDVKYEESLLEAIDRVIDDEGEIKPDASPGLMKIRRMLGSKRSELDRKFRVLINTYRKNGWLTDNVESFRNGRRVLSVPSEHKRKLRGIIHDESTTGRTAFIEPEGVIDINNDIFDLETEEKREIYRILKELSAILSPFGEQLLAYEHVVTDFDVIQAKALLALEMDANKPKLLDHPNFGYMKAYHPILLLKNKKEGKKTVPFGLDLRKPNRVLVLSGPNAGGKSVTMKGAGLLQMMVQSGMLIPVEQESEVGVFKKIFADIGDRQSLEDDLSTYSGRLVNAKRFIEESDKDTLILIDEFGSGTDPKIGGAIAESILRELNFKKIFGVITTHYSNLKVFAFKNKGLVNGAMIFDKESLSPTYKLKIGRPGSSYAYEIAEKSGLNNKVLKYARNKTGKNEKAIDELLVDLQQEKKEVEERLMDIIDKQDMLEKLIGNYERLQSDLEFKRKRIKLESKERVLQETQMTNREMEKIIREIKEAQNLEKAKKVAAEMKQKKSVLVNEVTDLKENIYYKEKEVKKDVKEGDFVKLRTGSATGQIDRIDKNKAVVMMGGMRVTVALRDLEHAKEPLDIRSTRSIRTSTSSGVAASDNKIDIRGMNMQEAMQVVESFFDNALMNNESSLRIVHGKGTGVLRKIVRQKLREYQNVEMDIYHPEPKEGGDGVTLVDIR